MKAALGGVNSLRTSSAILPFKQLPPKCSAGKLSTLIFVISLAVAWHVGLVVLERRLCLGQDGPSFAKLLLLAEVEVLRTLRAELKRRRLHKKDSCNRKLSTVEERLKELGQDGA